MWLESTVQRAAGLVIFIGLDRRNRDMCAQRLLSHHRDHTQINSPSVVQGTGVGGIVRSVVLFATHTTPRCRPVDGHGVQGHVCCAAGQAHEAQFVALEIGKREDVTRAQDSGDDGADQAAPGDLAEVAPGGALEQGVGTDQGTDEEESQPGGEQDVVDDQRYGRGALDANVAGALEVELCDLVGGHQVDDDDERGC